MAGRVQTFLGDDWEDTFDSLVSAPGALGGLLLGGLRQLRPVDVAAFGLVLAGWAWIGATFAASGVDQQFWHVALGLLPTLLWLAAGIAAALIFEVGGLGARTLGYWEAYGFMLLFALFGVLSLRVALSPESRRVYRGGPPAQ
jgi:hypothetical protein